MDIVVTIPKSEYKNDEIETEYFRKNDGSYQFWTLSKIPKNTKVGDRIYFIKNNRIESSMNIIDVVEDSFKVCDITGRLWKGKCILMLDDLRNESFSVNVKGFQGFRYFNKFLEANGYEMRT